MGRNKLNNNTLSDRLESVSRGRAGGCTSSVSGDGPLDRDATGHSHVRRHPLS
ncbi:hypothetical protein B0G80_4124 [Paraburkholderia sp. BL6669N2]|nr:hypothetical protein B0G80_4124 [Paraburkholderia sp. BL6669N2]